MAPRIFWNDSRSNEKHLASKSFSNPNPKEKIMKSIDNLRKNTLRTLFFLCLALNSPLFAQKNNPTWQPPQLSVEFTPGGGFYQDSVAVQLLSPGAIIFFTTDGSRPRETKSQRYTRPLHLKSTTVIRAIAVMGGKKSQVASQTFFVNEPETTFPVISISTSPDMLFDPEVGLFVKGPGAIDSLWHLPGANFWSRREISANFEFYETDGKCKWHDQVGLRLFGGMSRIFPQKSLQIVARSRYGEPYIQYPLFGKNGLSKFKYLVLRNSGSDFGKSHFRDAFMTNLVKKWEVDVQDYRPAHVYINGLYWGIYNMRDKVNRHFLAAHHGVDKDSVDIIEHKMTLRYGKLAHYQQLLNFIHKNSLSKPANYEYVNKRMQIVSFMDLQIAQIYFDNRDAGGNIKFWRPQTPNGRWRWILFDTDWGFGLNDPLAYRYNSLDFHTEPNGPHWPNPAWSTLLLRKLLENKDFERQFINRFADYLNRDLDTSRVLASVEKFYQRLLPEMPRHLERWQLSRSKWEWEVNVMRTFARERPRYIRQFLMDEFNTGELRDVSLQVDPGGRVIVNDNLETRGSFAGLYFERIPIRLQAIPDLGYRFVRWEGEAVNSGSPELILNLAEPGWKVRAVFEKYEHPLNGKIIINEISCNNKKCSDWIEIYNNSGERIDLENWILADRNNKFHFPSFTLPPKGYVIVCEDSSRFVSCHPDVQSIIGGLSFGLNKRREIIELFTPDASAVDSTGYNLPPSDSVFTLNLLLPQLDNGDPDNWELTPGTGSPGAANAYYLISSIQIRRSHFIQAGAAAAVLVLGILALWLRKKGYF
jgi:hypothetical protein